MTIEELEKVPFHFISHLSMEDEHSTTYASEDGMIGFCDYQPYRYGKPYGKSYRHWYIDGSVYKTWKSFVEALKDVQLKLEYKITRGEQ